MRVKQHTKTLCSHVDVLAQTCCIHQEGTIDIRLHNAANSASKGLLLVLCAVLPRRSGMLPPLA